MDLEVIELIGQDMGLNTYFDITEDELIVMISDRVKEMLETEKELLLSYLYRLDISNAKVNSVLRVSHIIPAHESLAVLIYQRQVERVRSKKKYKQKPIEGWDDF